MFALPGFSSQSSVSTSTFIRRFLLLLTTLIVLAADCRVNAQSVSFNGIVSVIASGLNQPMGVAVDGIGDVYIADYLNNTVHIYAPNGKGGYAYKSDVGTNLNMPSSVAVDSSGNVYITDTANNRVLKETFVAGRSTQSVIATTSASPLPSTSDLSGPFGVAVDGNGNVYIANTGRNDVLKLSPSGGSYIQRTLVDDSIFGGDPLSSPQGVAVDASANNIYIADTDNGKVYRDSYTAGFGYSRTQIDTGTLHLSYPSGVAVDGNGNVYIADRGNNRVLKDTALPLFGHYTQSVLASGTYASGVAVDGNGNVYVSDTFYNHVFKIAQDVDLGDVAVNATTAATQTLTYTFTAGGSGVTVTVTTKGALGADFVDAGTGSCTTQGITTTYNAGDTCTVNISFNPKFAGLREGAAVLKDSNGNPISTVYVHGIGISPQVIFSPGTESTIPLNVSNGAIGGAAVDGAGNLYVADNYNNSVHVYAPNVSGGGYTPKNDLAPSLGYTPHAVAVDGAGNVYVADGNNPGAVHKYSPNVSGSFTQQSDVAGGLARPGGVAVDSIGNIYVTDVVNSEVHVYGPDGSGGYTKKHDVGVSLGYQPTGLAVDGDGNVYIADGNRPGSVHKYSPNASVVSH
jgi:DNA-binding beta-propeller fold protein YncE